MSGKMEINDKKLLNLNLIAKKEMAAAKKPDNKFKNRNDLSSRRWRIYSFKKIILL